MLILRLLSLLMLVSCTINLPSTSAPKKAPAAKPASKVQPALNQNDEISEEDINKLLEELEKQPPIASVNTCNIEKALREMKEISEMQSEMQKNMNSRREELEKEGKAIDAEQAAYMKEEPTLNEAAKAEKMAKLQERAGSYFEKVQYFNQVEVPQQQQRLYAAGMEIINTVIAELCQGSNKICDIIVPSPFPCDPAFDATTKIVERANQKYSEKQKAKKSTSSAKAPAKPAKA